MQSQAMCSHHFDSGVAGFRPTIHDGEYVAHKTLHTNTVENFFSIFKRGVIGTYHHMSEAHLARYCAESDLRYNTRTLNDGERAATILKGGVGRRLTYRRIDLAA